MAGRVASAPTLLTNVMAVMRQFLAIALVLAASLFSQASPLPAATGPHAVTERLRAAVGNSHATVRLLAVDARKRSLTLTVSVRDPAAYLKHRYARVVALIYPALAPRFARIFLRVVDGRTGAWVLAYADIPDVGGEGVPTRRESWHIDWRLLDCARNLPLDDIEIDPDHAAPACPAR